jgi:hypothetical protein
MKKSRSVPHITCMYGVHRPLSRQAHGVLHCKENPIYVFPGIKLRGLSHNFHIHISVSDLYSPTIGPPTFLEQNRQTDCIGKIKSKYECMNWERGRAVSFLGIFVSNFCYSDFAVYTRSAESLLKIPPPVYNPFFLSTFVKNDHSNSSNVKFSFAHKELLFKKYGT